MQDAPCYVNKSYIIIIFHKKLKLIADHNVKVLVPAQHASSPSPSLPTLSSGPHFQDLGQACLLVSYSC